MTRAGWLRWLAPVGVAAVPPALIALLIAYYAVDVPYWDTWDWLDRHYGNGGRLELSRYWLLANEHRQFVALLVDRAILAMSSIDMLPRIYAKLPFSLCSVAVLYRLMRRTIPGVPRLVAAGSLSSLTFSLTYWPMWMDPRQHSVHLAVLGFVTAVYVVGAWAVSWRTLLAAGAACAVASLSHFSGTFSWLFIGALLWRRPFERRHLIAWLAAAPMLLVPHAIDLGASHALEPARFAGPIAAARFTLVFLGTPIDPGAPRFGYASVAMAAIGIVGSGVLLFLLRRGPDLRRAALPWGALSAWAAANAALAGWGRGLSGVDPARDSRYACVASQLWIGVTGLALLALYRPPDAPSPARRAAQVARGLLLLIAFGHLAANARPVISGRLDELTLRLATGRACLVAEARADDACLELLYPSALRVRALTAMLKARDASFLRPDPPGEIALTSALSRRLTYRIDRVPEGLRPDMPLLPVRVRDEVYFPVIVQHAPDRASWRFRVTRAPRLLTAARAVSARWPGRDAEPALLVRVVVESDGVRTIVAARHVPADDGAPFVPLEVDLSRFDHREIELALTSEPGAGAPSGAPRPWAQWLYPRLATSDPAP